MIVIFQPGFGSGFADVTPAGIWIETERVGEPSYPCPMPNPTVVDWPAGALPGSVPTCADAAATAVSGRRSGGESEKQLLHEDSLSIGTLMSVLHSSNSPSRTSSWNDQSPGSGTRTTPVA